MYVHMWIVEGGRLYLCNVTHHWLVRYYDWLPSRPYVCCGSTIVRLLWVHTIMLRLVHTTQCFAQGKNLI